MLHGEKESGEPDGTFLLPARGEKVARSDGWGAGAAALLDQPRGRLCFPAAIPALADGENRATKAFGSLGCDAGSAVVEALNIIVEPRCFIGGASIFSAEALMLQCRSSEAQRRSGLTRWENGVRFNYQRLLLA